MQQNALAKILLPGRPLPQPWLFHMIYYFLLDMCNYFERLKNGHK